MFGEHECNIWEGVYREWDDAPIIKKSAFNSTKWVATLAKEAKTSLANYQERNEWISRNALSRDYILSVVSAMAKKDGCTLKILDFGGGLGSSYLSVLASLQINDGLEFHIVEERSVCDKAKEIFPDNMNLHFHYEIPTSCGKFDIVHAGRSFQYVDDWKGLLSSFMGLRPSYLILAGVLAGDIDSFVSTQNYYGYKIRVRFLNMQELIREADKLGFRLVYKSLHVSKRLGKEGPLPMDNFPKDCRLEYPCQLLFELKQ